VASITTGRNGNLVPLKSANLPMESDRKSLTSSKATYSWVRRALAPQSAKSTRKSTNVKKSLRPTEVVQESVEEPVEAYNDIEEVNEEPIN